MTKSILVNGINKEIEFSSESVCKANLVHDFIVDTPVFKDEAALVLTKEQAQYLCGGQHLVDTMSKLVDNVEFICLNDGYIVEKGLYLENLENLDILH